MLPSHIIIIETYVLADFAFDDLALLALAALVVTLRFRLPRNSAVCVYASCAETDAKAASRMIEDFMVDWSRLRYAADDEICCTTMRVHDGGGVRNWK